MRCVNHIYIYIYMTCVIIYELFQYERSPKERIYAARRVQDAALRVGKSYLGHHSRHVWVDTERRICLC